jgi:hypothetical protein
MGLKEDIEKQNNDLKRKRDALREDETEMGFIDDLIDGIKQQQNPFTTVKKAFSDLGSRPIDDARKAPVGHWSIGTFIFFIVIGPFVFVVVVVAIAIKAVFDGVASLFK